MFKDNKLKALTFSYDDGVSQDIKLIEIFNKYGMKGTFNLNSGLMSQESKWLYKDKPVERLNCENIRNIYKGHEIAMHFLTHPNPLKINARQMRNEIVQDIENLENLFGYEIVGAAYPYGQYDQSTVNALKENHIKYARTVKASHRFHIDNNYLALNPTCKHDDNKLMELAECFINAKSSQPMLFYVWGHSYEFDGDDNWNVIEEFCEYISGRNDIFYGTNREVLNI